MIARCLPLLFLLCACSSESYTTADAGETGATGGAPSGSGAASTGSSRSDGGTNSSTGGTTPSSGGASSGGATSCTPPPSKTCSLTPCSTDPLCDDAPPWTAGTYADGDQVFAYCSECTTKDYYVYTCSKPSCTTTPGYDGWNDWTPLEEPCPARCLEAPGTGGAAATGGTSSGGGPSSGGTTSSTGGSASGGTAACATAFECKAGYQLNDIVSSGGKNWKCTSSQCSSCTNAGGCLECTNYAYCTPGNPSVNYCPVGAPWAQIGPCQ